LAAAKAKPGKLLTEAAALQSPRPPGSGDADSIVKFMHPWFCRSARTCLGLAQDGFGKKTAEHGEQLQNPCRKGGFRCYGAEPDGKKFLAKTVPVLPQEEGGAEDSTSFTIWHFFLRLTDAVRNWVPPIRQLCLLTVAY